MNPQNVSSYKIMVTPGRTAIYWMSTYGPTFGAGHDIHIKSDSNSNLLSSTSSSLSYPNQNFNMDGETFFQTVEVEIYQIT